MYYKGTFCRVLETIETLYLYLLDKTEKELLHTLQHDLSELQLLLLIRLYLRKHDWINVKKIDYSEIGNALMETLDGLASLNIIDFSSVLTLEQVLNMLTVNELNALVRDNGIIEGARPKSSSTGSKDAIISRLLSISKANSAVFRQTKLNFGNATLPSTNVKSQLHNLHTKGFIKLKEHVTRMLNRCMVLYFISSEGMTLNDAILVDLEKRSYPEYQVNRDIKIFETREDFLAYEQALALENHINELNLKEITLSDFEAECKEALLFLSENITGPEKPELFLRYSRAWVMMRILSGPVLTFYQSLKDYGKAIELINSLLSKSLRPRKRGFLWTRLYMNTKHLERRNKDQSNISSLVVQRALADPTLRLGDRYYFEHLDEDDPSYPVDTIQFEKCFLPGIIGKKSKIMYPILDSFTEEASGSSIDDAIDLDADDDKGQMSLLSVEQAALKYYEDQGYEGIHGEGAFFSHLFTILFWDIIFSSSYFITPYQTSPLDLHYPELFYKHHETGIDARLKDIESLENISLIIEATYAKHFNRYAVSVQWNMFPCAEQLIFICSCFPGNSIALVMKRFIIHGLSCRKGLPDLLLYKTGNVLLVEVKGPRDRLSNDQLAWLEFLLPIIPVRICKLI